MERSSQGRRSGRRAGVATSVLAVGVALSGCGLAQEAGAAAVVGGETISVSQVQELSRELVEVSGSQGQAPDAGDAQRRTLSLLVAGHVLEAAADEVGASVTAGEVDARYQEYVESTGGEAELRQALVTQANVAPSWGREYIREMVLLEKIADELVPGDAQDPAVAEQRQQAFTQLLEQTTRRLDVDVNPRYGTFDADRLDIVALPSAGLARSTATETPAPAAPGGSGQG